MHLLYPIGLIALAGLLIPLIIHLWKLKQGKTLRIGSIALLGAGSPFTSRSYQITDWLLLFLRMLLLGLLAFFLAEPYMKLERDKNLQKGWLLLEKDNFPFLYKTQKKSIDSLIQAGYELHDFGLKFQKISLKDTLGANSERKAETRPKLSHYALLRELNTQVNPNFPVYLFVDRRLQNLGGDLPRIDFQLIWKEIKGVDTMSTWTSTFAHKTFEANSTPALTSFKRLDGLQEEPAIKVLVYADEEPDDVNYLKAAIQAIAQETKRNIEVRLFNDKNISGLNFDVGFWISGKTVHSDFLARIVKGGRLFNYAGEKTTAVSSWIDVEPGGRGNIADMALHKRSIATVYPGKLIWTDGFGRPLLTRAKEKTIDHYRFYSRLNPSWTDLVWNEKFVAVMLPILLGNDGSATGFGFEISPDDQRNSFVATAVLPQSVGPKFGLSTTAQKEEPLQKAFWLMAILVFALERFISFRHKNKVNHG